MATHTYSTEETEAYCDHVNDVLEGDPILARLLPLTPDDIFAKCADGLVLCKLVNDAVPETIDERVLNKGPKINKYQAVENCNLAIESAKGIGCSVVNIGPTDLIEQREHILLGMIWQIIRIGLMSQITLTAHPELYRLLEPGEEMKDFLNLPPEKILLRWFNYHLKNAGSERRVKNFGGDIKDSECYTLLLNQLAPNLCDKNALRESNVERRAEMVIGNARKIDCDKFVKARDIAAGNPKLNLAFVANLFNTLPCLDPLTEEEKGNVEDWMFDDEGSREARAFQLWINSLGIDPFVHNLFEDLKNGLVLLKVIDAIEPGRVDWKRVNKREPMHRIKAVENTNYAVDIGKDLRFSLVGVGGIDITDGKEMLTLALVWQLMRHHVLSVLKEIGGGKPVSEKQMIDWSN
jgi:plastin-1